MQQLLVTGSDTGVGKTRVVAALARILGEDGSRVQIVKVVETGVVPGSGGDAERALRMSGTQALALTLESFSRPLAPAAAAAAEGRRVSFEGLVEKAWALPECDWRIFEGAGGIATPLDDRGRDWADFAEEAGVDRLVIVVPDRLGAINQARLAFGRAEGAGLAAGIWLNTVEIPDAATAESNRAGLQSAGVPVWAEQGHGADLPADPGAVHRRLSGVHPAGPAADSFAGRCAAILAEREKKHLRRRLRVAPPRESVLNLADNDYLDLARDPALAAAAAEAAVREGTSASASPLITGWTEGHERLVAALCSWHGFDFGLLWTSGYAANGAVLGTLAQRGDRVYADRLIHHSMIAGLLRGGARIQRYPHLDLDRLERWLERDARQAAPALVVTESVFSMDGDFPDLGRLAELKRKHRFFWVLDEAHALGWYGPGGAGLALASGASGEVDVLVGTLGKTLASGGAYSLFRDEAVRDALVNVAGEFVYSTALSPVNAACALAAIGRVRDLSADQGRWQEASRCFRGALRSDGWEVPDGDSPIVPVRLDDEDRALGVAEGLRAQGILVAAVRPPTVPAGTSRLRISLKRTLGPADFARVRSALRAWSPGRGVGR